MTGPLDLGGNSIYKVRDPQNPQDASTKKWTEDNFLPSLSDIDMRGNLVRGSGSPVLGTDLVTKNYFETHVPAPPLTTLFHIRGNETSATTLVENAEWVGGVVITKVGADRILTATLRKNLTPGIYCYDFDVVQSLDNGMEASHSQ